MKKLIALLGIAMFTGLGAGTAVTYLRVAKLPPADSIPAAAAPGQPVSNNGGKETPDSTRSHTESFVTPAESLRAVAASRTRLADATRSLPDASDTTSAKPATQTPAAASSGKDTASTATTPAAATTRAAAAIVKAVRDSSYGELPEPRLAKIFAQMQARDAAKVLEQMEDSDIRTVLSLMGDRQAAAILSALPPARAAAITRRSIKAPGDNHERD